MINYFIELDKELDLIFHGKLPRDNKSFKKIKCNLKIGKRIYWYYKEDLDFALNENKIDKDFDVYYPGYSGIVILKPDTDSRSIDGEDCIIVIDRYPCEKCNPEVDWLPLYKLIDCDDLVEITDKEVIDIKDLKKVNI